MSICYASTCNNRGIPIQKKQIASVSLALLFFSTGYSNVPLVPYREPVPIVSSTECEPSVGYNTIINYNVGDDGMENKKTTDAANTWPICMQVLDEILALQDNWDDNGALSFTPQHIECARKLLNCLPFEPEVFPTARSSVQFEYEKDDDYLELELFENSKLKLFKMNAREEITKYITFEGAVEAVKEFHETNI